MNVYEKFEYLQSRKWEYYDKWPFDIYPAEKTIFYNPYNLNQVLLSPHIEGGRRRFWWSQEGDLEALINYCFDLQKEKENG